VMFFMGHTKVVCISGIFEILDEKDLFVFSKNLRGKIEFKRTKGHTDIQNLDFYAPFLEEQRSKIEFLKHSNMYCPKLKKIDTTGYGNPEVLYVSPSFDVSQLPEDWKMAVKYYTPEQLEKREMAKKELLAYIAINPELSNASLNCPKPDSVSQKKWDELVNLKNKLMALLCGEKNMPKCISEKIE